MAAMKRARVDRAMVTEMRVVGNEEGEGNDEKDDIGDKGGVRRRGRWRRHSRAMATRVMGKQRR